MNDTCENCDEPLNKIEIEAKRKAGDPLWACAECYEPFDEDKTDE